MFKKSAFLLFAFLFLFAANLPAMTTGTGSGSITGNFTDFGYYDHWYVSDHGAVQFGNDPEVTPLPTPPMTGNASKVTFRLVGIPNNDTSNYVEFTPENFNNVQKGETFVLGYFSYFNGDWWAMGNIVSATATLQMVSNSADTDFDNQTLTEHFSMLVTPDDPDPVLNADFFYFTNHPEYGSFRVFEDQVGIVQILGKFGSLDPVGFGQVLTPNTAFVDPGIELKPTPAVPEPSTFILLGAGLAGLGIIRKRFRK
jgi:hypothetical protein